MDGLILVGILLLQENAGPPAGDGLQIEASMAFGGHVSAAGFTEVNVRAYSITGGELALGTGASAANVGMTIHLPAGQSREVRMPLVVDPASPAPILRAKLDGLSPLSVALTSIRHSQPPALLVGAEATRLLLHEPDTEAIVDNSLPHFAPAYRNISALAIDGATLAALDAPQLRALLQYAGTCGRLLLIGASKQVEQVFLNRAACDGRFLGTVDSNADAAAAFLRIRQTAAAPLVSRADLGRLLANPPGGAVDLSALAVFWSGYLLIFVVLSLPARTRLAALGFSGVGTLMVLAIWPATASRTYAAWAEASTHERVARYSGMQRYSSPRSDTHNLPLAGFGAYAARIEGGDYSIQWQAENAQSSLDWQAAAFQQIDLMTDGSFAIESRLRASSGNDVANVCNEGNGESRQAYLRWQENTYQLPPLLPGMRWSSADALPLEAEALEPAELRLFARRAAGHAVTFLQPLPVAGGGENDRAWLMRYEPDAGGDAPCGT